MSRYLTRPHALLTAVIVITLAACSEDRPEQAAAPPTAEPEAIVPEVLVLHSDDLIPWLQSENWWGDPRKEGELSAPNVIVAAIKPSWRENAQQMQVTEKKQIFYRLMLPMVMYANEMVMRRRDGLLQAQRELDDDGSLSSASLDLVQGLLWMLPDDQIDADQALTANDSRLPGVIDELLYRVDIVPAGLALGQAAYESGYGTSRFAVEGNSLFGQWTYGDEGIKPQQQRASKGDHRIKAFDWPFDSVRGYFINLMTHPAYEDFRQLRAQHREAGEPLDSLVLADGLLSYSERGQAYVDSLKGMIRVNHLDVADQAVFRDEPLRFIITEQSVEEVEATQQELAAMRETGELADIFERMNLD